MGGLDRISSGYKAGGVYSLVSGWISLSKSSNRCSSSFRSIALIIAASCNVFATVATGLLLVPLKEGDRSSPSGGTEAIWSRLQATALRRTGLFFRGFC